MQYVVFGATGYIGSYLFQRLKDDGYSVIGTSRRSSSTDEMIHYDIEKDNINHITAKIEGKEKTAIVCIAEPKIDRCYEHYEQAYEINVIKTKKLIHELSEEGFQIIYFSTDNVFDGICGGYTEESQTNALNKYGMMKAEMEQYLLKNKPAVCIIRIPKVVSASKVKQNVFEEWRSQIEKGMIRCIRDNRMSFLYIDDIYQACLMISERNMQGLYNIAGDNAYSRAELAAKFYEKLGVAEKVKIQECDLRQFPFKDNRPLNIWMKNLKFKTETGYSFTTMDSVIDRFIENM